MPNSTDVSPKDGSARPLPLGELLVHHGLLTPVQLQEALTLQKQWGTRLGDIILAKGWVRARDLYPVLSNQYKLEFVDLIKNPVDSALVAPEQLDQYSQTLTMPWRRDAQTNVLTVVTADPRPGIREEVQAQYGAETQVSLTSKFDIIWEIQRIANAYMSARAVDGLAERSPDHSARIVFTTRQLWVLYGLGTALLLACLLAPIPALIGLNAIAIIGMVVTLGFRAMLSWIGSDQSIDVKVSDEEVQALQDSTLPTYSVLVPLYKEPNVLPIIAAAIRKLDYPLSKLDIKLVLEEDDHETIDAAKALGLEANFELIRVPFSNPRTKPKACNYALSFARGEYVTIYDAEDKPQPDQLKKVVCAFRKASPDTACIQARLNYFNAFENWLTRLFTLEYSLWFDFYLPALESLRIPIPLGGTSNHFPIRVLRQLNAWDPYNVTEDADLGVRLTQLGYRTGVVNSTTYEEAASRIRVWIGQRSRWIKGYLQTYLVHMRHPVRFAHSVGTVGFLGFQFFVGSVIFMTLLVPLTWLVFALWLLTGTHTIDFLFPSVLLYLSLFSLLFGNGVFIYLSMIGAFKRKLYSLMPIALTIPVYWFLMFVAGYKAIWQLIFNPFYWEKTTHGISSYTPGERAAALGTVSS